MEYRTQPYARRTPLHIKVMCAAAAVLAVLVIVLLCIKPVDSARQTEATENSEPTEEESTQAEEEIELSDVQASGAFAYSMNPVVTLREEQLDLLIENLSTGEYALQVEITISGGEHDGQTVYQTGFIAPSYGVASAKILTPLPEGLYGALAEIHAIDMNTEQSIGSVNEAIVISVPAAPTPSPAPSPTPSPALSPTLSPTPSSALTPDAQDAGDAEIEDIPPAEGETTPALEETDELSVTQLEEILGISPRPEEDES